MNAPSWFLSLALVAALSAAAHADADPRGPVDNPGIHPVVDAEGVHSPGFKFDPVTCRKPGPWQAKWIWLPGDAGKIAAAFRKEVTLAEAPQRVAAWLSADAKYRLYINGRLAARGPVDQGRDYEGGSTERWFYDYRDLTQFFHKGTNTIAVEVFRYWPIAFTVSRGHPGLIFEAEITQPDGTKHTIATDAAWKAASADWFSAANGITYDARREPPGWRMAGFDDAAWKPCEVTKDIWSPLIPSEIPPLMEARYPVLRLEKATGGVKIVGWTSESVPAATAGRTFSVPQANRTASEVHPTTAGSCSSAVRNITVTADGSFRVVFDRVLSAYPTLKLRGGRGARVAIQSCRKSAAILGGGETYYESPFMDEIAPAYTVSFTNVTEPIIVEDVGANFTSQPVDYVGSFECSDEKLNKIWKASRWAVQICMQTHHLDSPNHQEPICDPGDYVIEAQVAYYAFGQPWLARQDIRKFAWLLKNEKYRNFHTSYSLYWLEMLEDYVVYTGDKSLVEEMQPYIQELLETYMTYLGKNGLISEAPNYMFMDWVEIGGFNCHHPPAVIGQGYLTALYCGGLQRAERLTMDREGEGRLTEFDEASKACAAAFRRELWVDSKGLYRDGKPFQSSVKPGQWLPEDKTIETFSPHVNLLAVLYDLAPLEKKRAIVDKVMSQQPLNTQPWFMHTVFEAICWADLFDKYGAQQLRRWEIVPETQSFREMWHGGDLSHGWCSTPLVQMSSRILGMKIHSWGCNSMAICPRCCDLAWAKGTVPTPHGIVAISWKAEADRRSIDTAVPKGIQYAVHFTAVRWDKTTAMVDGSVQEPLHRSHDPVYVLIASQGSHHFELRNKMGKP